MEQVFPFGFPWPTAGYLTLYVLTLVLHVIPMNYVLAGSVWLAVRGLTINSSASKTTDPAGSSKSWSAAQAVDALLRDWLTFALGGAITAGVAPLLFVQILYQEEFYSANLLLFHRWMSILPVLIIAFYLLYLLKSETVKSRGRWLVMLLQIVVLACFVFVGYTWTENHLLSLQGQAGWVSFYESRQVAYYESALIPRLLLWSVGAVPTACVLIGWQLWGWERRDNGPCQPTSTHLVARLGLGGLMATGACGLAYLAFLTPDIRSRLATVLAWPYLLMAVLGGLAQLTLWWRILTANRWSWRALAGLSGATIVSLICMNVVREVIRLASIDMTQLYDQHAKAAQVGGLGVFLVFLVLNLAVIAWCLRGVSLAARARDAEG